MTGWRDPRGASFTDADRVPVDTDISLGLADHTVSVPTALLATLCVRSRGTDPRDPVRYAALVDDIRQHGIGNPVAIFCDQRRVALAEGEHRIAAALTLGIGEIPTRVIRLADLTEVSSFRRDSRPIGRNFRPYLP